PDAEGRRGINGAMHHVRVAEMPRPALTLPQRNTDHVGHLSGEVAAELRARLGTRNCYGLRSGWNPNGGWRVLMWRGWGVLMKTKSEIVPHAAGRSRRDDRMRRPGNT